MKQIRLSHLLVGLVGLVSIMWIHFTVSLPIFAYLIIVPLTCLPGLFLIMSGLAPALDGTKLRNKP